jgi:hypothetical protein
MQQHSEVLDCVAFLSIVGSDPWLVVPRGGALRRDDSTGALLWEPTAFVNARNQSTLPCSARFVRIAMWCNQVDAVADLFAADGVLAPEHAVMSIVLVTRGMALVASAFGALSALRTVEAVLASWSGCTALQLLRSDAMVASVGLHSAGECAMMCEHVPTADARHLAAGSQCCFAPASRCIQPTALGEQALCEALHYLAAHGATHIAVGVSISVSSEAMSCPALSDVRAKKATRALPAKGSRYIDVVPARRLLGCDPSVAERRVRNTEELRHLMHIDAHNSLGQLVPSGLRLMGTYPKKQVSVPPIALARLIAVGEEGRGSCS